MGVVRPWKNCNLENKGWQQDLTDAGLAGSPADAAGLPAGLVATPAGSAGAAAGPAGAPNMLRPQQAALGRKQASSGLQQGLIEF